MNRIGESTADEQAAIGQGGCWRSCRAGQRKSARSDGNGVNLSVGEDVNIIAGDGHIPDRIQSEQLLQGTARGQIHCNQRTRIQSHVSRPASHGHGDGRANESTLVNDPRRRGVGDVDDGQTGRAVGHRDEPARTGHARRIPGGVDVGDDRRIDSAVGVEDGHSRGSFGCHHDLVGCTHVDRCTRGLRRGDDAGLNHQTTQRIGSLLDLRTVRNAVAIGVGLGVIRAVNELDDIGQAVVVGIRSIRRQRSQVEPRQIIGRLRAKIGCNLAVLFGARVVECHLAQCSIGRHEDQVLSERFGLTPQGQRVVRSQNFGGV